MEMMAEQGNLWGGSPHEIEGLLGQVEAAVLLAAEMFGLAPELLRESILVRRTKMGGSAGEGLTVPKPLEICENCFFQAL